MAVSKEAEEVVVEDAFTEDDCPKASSRSSSLDVHLADMATLLWHFLY